ncbi:MAG: PKD domain-containing protein, partial [Candidatus Thermoplasmatota archaeon]
EIKNGSSYFNYVPKDTKMKLGDYKTEGTLIYETWKLLKQIPNESQIYELAMKSFSTGLYETAWRGNGKMGLDRDIAYWEKEQAAHVRTSAVYYYAQKWLERKDESIREEDIDFDSENEYIISNKKIFSVFEKKGGKIAYAFDYSGKQIIGNNPTGWLDEGDAITDAITSTTTNTHYSKKRAKYFEGSKSYSFEDLGYENQLYKPYIDKENKTISFSYGNIKKEFGIIENFIICKYENPSKLSFRISSSPDLKDILLNGKKNIEKIEYGWKNNAKGTRIIFNGTFKGEGENSMIKYMEFEGIKNFTLSVQIGDISSTIPNEKPKIISISPLNYTILPINFTIKVEVVDEESEIKHVEVRIDNNDWFKIKKNKYWEYSLILNEGAHKIDVRAYDGLLYSDIKSILIFVEEKKNSAPIAKAVYYSFKKIVYFDASNSYDFDDDKLIYNWSFGDGKNGSGVVTHHNYEEYGIYDVKLKIDDGKGGVSFENLTIHLSWEKEKNGKENGGNQILMLILILLIISILIIILVHFRKHKRF